MKYALRLFGFSILSILLYSHCSRKSTDVDNGIQFVRLEEVETLKFGDTHIFDTCFLVKLETSSEVLIGEIAQLEIFDDKIFICDKSSEKILSFDLQRNFKASVGKKGRGPEEYASLSGFYVNPYDSTINLFDPLMMMVKKYSLDGEYINGVKHNNQNLCFIAKAAMLNEEQLFCYHHSNWKDNYIFSVVNINDYNHSQEIESYPYRSSKYVSYTLSNHPYVVKNGKAVYTSLFSNILCTYENGELKPYFAVENKKEMNREFLEARLKETEGDYHKVARDLIKENVYNVGFLNIFENDRFLLTDFVADKSTINAILWDKKQKKGLYITKYSTYTPDLQLFKSTFNNSVVCIWDRSAILTFRRNMADKTITGYSENVQKMAENFNDEEDNPILIVHTFKNE